jgi:hypothetical protein
VAQFASPAVKQVPLLVAGAMNVSGGGKYHAFKIFSETKTENQA